jgi:hypothetical protein
LGLTKPLHVIRGSRILLALWGLCGCNLPEFGVEAFHRASCACVCSGWKVRAAAMAVLPAVQPAG